MLSLNSDFLARFHAQDIWRSGSRPDLDPSGQLITGPPTYSVWGQYWFALWRLASSVTFHIRQVAGQ